MFSKFKHCPSLFGKYKNKVDLEPEPSIEPKQVTQLGQAPSSTKSATLPQNGTKFDVSNKNVATLPPSGSVDSATVSTSSSSNSNSSYHGNFVSPDDNFRIQEKLQGGMNLKIKITHLNKETSIMIDRKTPIIDILARIAKDYHFVPANYMILIDNENQKEIRNSRPKSSDQIGLLDTNKILIVPKPIKENGNNKLPFNQTIRFTVNLPKDRKQNHLFVRRFPIETKINKIIELICKERDDLDPEKHVLVKPFKSGHSVIKKIDLNQTLREYGLKDAYFITKEDFEIFANQFTSFHYDEVDDPGSNRLGQQGQNDWSQSTPNISIMKQDKQSADTQSLISKTSRSYKKKPAPPPPLAKSIQNLTAIRDENESLEDDNGDKIIKKQPSNINTNLNVNHHRTRLTRQNSGSDSSGYHDMSNTEANTPTDSNSPAPPVSPTPESDTDNKGLVKEQNKNPMPKQRLSKLRGSESKLRSSASFSRIQKKYKAPKPPPSPTDDINNQLKGSSAPSSPICSDGRVESPSSIEEYSSVPHSSISSSDLSSTYVTYLNDDKVSDEDKTVIKMNDEIKSSNNETKSDNQDFEDKQIESVENLPTDGDTVHIISDKTAHNNPTDSTDLKLKEEIEPAIETEIEIATEKENQSIETKESDQVEQNVEVVNEIVPNIESKSELEEVELNKDVEIVTKSKMDIVADVHVDHSVEQKQRDLQITDRMPLVDQDLNAKEEAVKKDFINENKDYTDVEKQQVDDLKCSNVNDFKTVLETDTCVQVDQQSSNKKEIEESNNNNNNSNKNENKIEENVNLLKNNDNTDLKLDMNGKCIVPISGWKKNENIKNINNNMKNYETNTSNVKCNSPSKDLFEKRLESTLDEFNETLNAAETTDNINGFNNNNKVNYNKQNGYTTNYNCHLNENVNIDDEQKMISVPISNQTSSLSPSLKKSTSNIVNSYNNEQRLKNTTKVILNKNKNDQLEEQQQQQSKLSSNSFSVRDGIKKFNTISQQDLSSLRNNNCNNSTTNLSMGQTKNCSIRRSTSRLSPNNQNDEITTSLNISKKLPNFHIAPLKSESSIDIYAPTIDSIQYSRHHSISNDSYRPPFLRSSSSAINGTNKTVVPVNQTIVHTSTLKSINNSTIVKPAAIVNSNPVPIKNSVSSVVVKEIPSATKISSLTNTNNNNNSKIDNNKITTTIAVNQVNLKSNPITGLNQTNLNGKCFVATSPSNPVTKSSTLPSSMTGRQIDRFKNCTQNQPQSPPADFIEELKRKCVNGFDNSSLEEEEPKHQQHQQSIPNGNKSPSPTPQPQTLAIKKSETKVEIAKNNQQHQDSRPSSIVLGNVVQDPIIPPPPPPPPLSAPIIIESGAKRAQALFGPKPFHKMEMNGKIKPISKSNSVDSRLALLDEIKNFQKNSHLRQIKPEQPYTLRKN